LLHVTKVSMFFPFTTQVGPKGSTYPVHGSFPRC
jgi:hypothetical protein